MKEKIYRFIMMTGLYLGIILFLIAVIALAKNVQEIKQDPIIYGMEKHEFSSCTCYDIDGKYTNIVLDKFKTAPGWILEVVYIGQAEVINFLKTCEEPVTRRQIAEGLDCNPIKVSHVLKDLLKFNEVEFVEYSRDKASELVGYVLLRRTRFFFLFKQESKDLD